MMTAESTAYSSRLFLLLPVAFLCLAISPQHAVAAAETTQNLGLNDESGSLMLAIGKVFSALAVVVGLMLLLLHFVRRLGFGKISERSGSLIQVLDTKMIAQKKYVAVLQLPGERIVVGVTDQQINFLTSLGETTATEEHPADQSPKEQKRFSNLLRSAEGLLVGRKENSREGN